MPEERQRSHARTSKQRARANLQLLDQTGDGGGDRDVAKIAQSKGETDVRVNGTGGL